MAQLSFQLIDQIGTLLGETQEGMAGLGDILLVDGLGTFAGSIGIVGCLGLNCFVPHNF